MKTVSVHLDSKGTAIHRIRPITSASKNESLVKMFASRKKNSYAQFAASFLVTHRYIKMGQKTTSFKGFSHTKGGIY